MRKFKDIGWFLLKSPQRKMLGYSTLITDVKGWWSKNFKKSSEGLVWVCVGNFNRSESLLKNLLGSMALHPEGLGLSVFDCGSNDIENLEAAVRKVWKGPLEFASEKAPFSRSYAFNRAISQAPEGLVLVCDADISLPGNMQALVHAHVSEKSVWFPVCQYQLTQESKEWKWFEGGTGIFAARKEQVAKAGYYDETHTTWGREDWKLFFDFYRAGIAPLRSKVEGLYHHWHVPSQPEGYEKWF